MSLSNDHRQSSDGYSQIAVFGAGAMGRRHAEIINACDSVGLFGLIDPSPTAQDLARELGTTCYPNLASMLEHGRPSGIIIATPNAMHFENTLDCIAARIPTLVEKPIATCVSDAHKLVKAATLENVPLLVGHHRRHNPIIQAAKAAIDDGRIGRLVSVNAMAWLMKPESYFAPEWRRSVGAGPILTNLIHDIDLLRHFCGEVSSVQSFSSSAVRDHAVEDTAVVILRFRSGLLGTLSVSDTAVAPWSWELTAGENADYPDTKQACYQIAGTLGALEVPTLRLWENAGAVGWLEPLTPSSLHLPTDPQDPLLNQIIHFADVINGNAKPLVTGADGVAALEILDAIMAAAKTGHSVALSNKEIAQ